MNKYGIPLMMCSAALVTACAVGYQARGQLGDVTGTMRGKAYPGNFSGGGRFILADREGRLQCDGQLLPPENSPALGSCQGETGEGVVRCSDGREIPVRWSAISCRAFEGSGEDKAGNRLVFRVERGG